MQQLHVHITLPKHAYLPNLCLPCHLECYAAQLAVQPPHTCIWYIVMPAAMQVINLVMATDMKQHFSIMSNFGSLFGSGDNNRYVSRAAGDGWHELV